VGEAPAVEAPAVDGPAAEPELTSEVHTPEP